MLLSDYPYAGLIKMQELAERAEVSQPSISRFVIKIGLTGFPELQKHLVSELREGGSLSCRHSLHIRADQRGGYLNGFLHLAAEQMASAGQAVTETQFEQICSLVADPKRSIYAVGGRISDTIAQHLSFIFANRVSVFITCPRPRSLARISVKNESWRYFFLVDFRRYQKNLLQLAKQAQAQKVQVVLMTDQWLSPATRYTSEVLVVPIETGTIWDSYAPALALPEKIVTRVAGKTWPQTRNGLKHGMLCVMDLGRENMSKLPKVDNNTKGKSICGNLRYCR